MIPIGISTISRTATRPHTVIRNFFLFAGSISVKSQKLENALASGDIAAYTTLVHSLKSSARTVGATKVSELARLLEAAGKHNETDRLFKDTPQLLSIYRDLEDPLKEILNKGVNS